MSNKNVNSFLTTGFIDLNTSDSLLSVVNGDLKRVTNANISLPIITAKSGSFSNIVTSPNLVYNTGIQNISGNKTFLDSGIFSLSGTLPLSLPSNPLAIVGSGNTYVQFNIQNIETGTYSSADLVITANNGTDSTNFINLGINNVGYNDPLYNNATGLDGYLFIDGGDLDIGTRTSGKIIEFHVGGTTAEKVISRIDASGMNMVSGTYRVNNLPYNTFTINFQHTSDLLSAGNNFFGNYATITSTTRASRTLIVPEAATARKATWSQLVLVTGNPGLNSSGLFINATTNTTGIISSSINNQSITLAANYYGDINPPITVSAGDQIVCSIFCPTFATAFPSGVKNSVNVYFYN